MLFSKRMDQNQLLHKILESVEANTVAIQETRSDVKELRVEMTETRADVKELRTEVTEMNVQLQETRSDVRELRTEMTETRADVKELRTESRETREVVDFLKDHMVSRDELDAKLTDFKAEIISHIDGFIVMHQKLEAEVMALRAKTDRLESYIRQLAQHAHINLIS